MGQVEGGRRETTDYPGFGEAASLLMRYPFRIYEKRRHKNLALRLFGQHVVKTRPLTRPLSARNFVAPQTLSAVRKTGDTPNRRVLGTQSREVSISGCESAAKASFPAAFEASPNRS
jgi:hypothetical protein